MGRGRTWKGDAEREQKTEGAGLEVGGRGAEKKQSQKPSP